MKKLLIGVDPDVQFSGVAWYMSKDSFKLFNLTFFELFDSLKDIETEATVYIEAGWLNKSNWHKVKGTAAINAEIGKRTGANHETGKKIVEMCEYLKLDYVLVKPTTSKINSVDFNKTTGHKGRSNQEQRDACMLVFGR